MTATAIERIRVDETVIPSVIRKRKINEEVRPVSVNFKVEVLRWNPEKRRHEKPALHFQSEEMAVEDLLTNVGRNLIHNASFMTGAQPAALTYYAICNPAVFSPAAGDTTLDTEITTPAGLARHQPTGVVDGVTESFTHASGTNTTVVVAAFKNNGAVPVTGIKGYGNFNAAVAGTLGTESTFASLDLDVNEILKLTVTITLG